MGSFPYRNNGQFSLSELYFSNVCSALYAMHAMIVRRGCGAPKQDNSESRLSPSAIEAQRDSVYRAIVHHFHEIEMMMELQVLP